MSESVETINPSDDEIDVYSESIGLTEIEAIEESTYQIIERLREKVFAPDKTKVLNLRFSISEASNMIGRSPTAIRDAEADGRLPEAAKSSKNRRIGYTLAEVNNMRKVFGTLPWRNTDTDDPLIMAIQNFKGGCGKSTLTCHIAQGLALQGLRVLVIDADSQGSSTILFGLNPDEDIDPDHTLAPFLEHGGPTSLDYAIRDTYFDGIRLIPANLHLYSAEYTLAAKVSNDATMFNRLREGINTVADQFDVILIDPPPSLGMISLSVLRAANALLVPIRPAVVDFSSTAHFFTMLVEALSQLEGFGMKAEYKFIHTICNDMDEGKSAHKEITRMMQSIYGNMMLDTILKDSAEIDNASSRMMTVFDLDKPITSRETHKRCKAYLNSLVQEMMLIIRKTWPSHRHELRKEGLI